MKKALALGLGIAAFLLVLVVVNAGPPTPITATVTASTQAPGFIYTAGSNLITRHRIYSGTVSDIDGDSLDETILIIEDSVCKLPCSITELQGRNNGVMIIYLSGGKVVEGRFEGRLMPGGSLDGRWQITRVAGGLAGGLIHGHGSGTYVGTITGPGFQLTISGSAHL